VANSTQPTPTLVGPHTGCIVKTAAKNGPRPLPEFRILDVRPTGTTPDRHFGGDIQKASHPGTILSVREPLAVLPCV
jgi:hypothetical protein